MAEAGSTDFPPSENCVGDIPTKKAVESHAHQACTQNLLPLDLNLVQNGTK